MLGRHTPWLIIVAGALYGTYKFRELQQNAQKDARAEAKTELDLAHKDLRETYEQIGKMHEQQLSNLSSMLKVNKETAENTQQKQTELNKLLKETEKTQLEPRKQRRRSDKVKEEALLGGKRKLEAQTHVRWLTVRLRSRERGGGRQEKGA